MASVKRALIVDDSKSARTFLSRILEKYDIEVDSAESAEQAIEYLGQNRPDVIFMDHLMPGMDGFQAVQAIKNNPRTATIPIMMYTSQEGELYLGQARALGAVGVLPKQIKPADVSKVLYQLHLLPDRRTGEQSTFRPVMVGGTADTEGGPPLAASRPLTDAMLREHFAELRRVVVASLDSQSERLSGELRAALADAPPRHTTPVLGLAARRPWPYVVAVIAVVIAVVASLLLAQARGERRALLAELAQLRARAAAAAPVSPAQPVQRSDAPPPAAVSAPPGGGPSSGAGAGRGGAGDTGAAVTGVHKASLTETRSSAASDARGVSADARAGIDAKPLVISVPYGDDPFAGPRVEMLRDLFERLTAAGYRGIVEIRTFPGRFCLMGNPTDGYSLAPDETAFARCDLVAGSPNDSMAQPQRVSLAFANLLGELRNRTRGAVDVQILGGDPAAASIPYPTVSDALTAGEWNRAGSANNRLEVRVR